MRARSLSAIATHRRSRKLALEAPRLAGEELEPLAEGTFTLFSGSIIPTTPTR